jgi:AraC-like DNA-binding protein
MLLHEVAESTGDPLAGLHVAGSTSFDDYHAWGRGITRAGTLLEAITFATREIAQIQTGTRVTMVHDGAQVHLSMQLLGRPEINPRHHVEMNLLVLRRMLDLAVRPVPARACFPHDNPHVDELEGMFGPDLSFGSCMAELVFDHAALRLPLRRVAATQTPRLKDSTQGVHHTALQVMQVLRQLILFERPTAQTVASAISMNVRRMQRHLAVWGVTFHDLLDQYRSRMALDYMQSRKYSVTDVAFRLGYSDTAHFIRAFRRWNGISPRHLRSIRVVGEPHPSQGGQPVEVVHQQNLLAAVAR